MATKQAAPLLDLKSIEDTGQFSGYGAVFGNVDFYGDIIEPGAFAKSLAEHKRKKTSPRMFWAHDPDQPIGKWLDVSEDGKGLFVEGQLNMGVQRAREAHALLKAGDIDGLSIGYYPIKSEPDDEKKIVRLKEVRLVEVSVVSLAANEKARVGAVKSERMEDFARRLRDGEPMPIKEFEDILREAGVPKAMAVQIASVGYAKAIRSESEGKASEPAFKALQEAARAFLPSA